MAKKRQRFSSPAQREEAKQLEKQYQDEIKALTKRREATLQKIIQKDEQLAFDAVEVIRKQEFDKLYELRKKFYAEIAEAKANGEIPKSTNLKKISLLPANKDNIKNVPLFMKRRYGTAGIVKITTEKQSKAIKKKKTADAKAKAKAKAKKKVAPKE